MDFSLDALQQATADLTKQILRSTVTPDSLTALEAEGRWLHEAAL